MPGPMIALGAGALVGGLGAAYAGKKGADATRDASNVAAASTAEGIAEQRRQYDTTRADLEPWRSVGRHHLYRLNHKEHYNEFDPGEFDFTLEDFEADPGREYREEQTQRALENTALARGDQLSGRQVDNFMRVAGEMASQEYGKSHDRAVREYLMERQRKMDDYNRLAAISGTGQVATTQGAQLGGQTSSNISNIIQSGGRTQAGLAQTGGQIAGQTAMNIAGAANQGIENYVLAKMVGGL